MTTSSIAGSRFRLLLHPPILLRSRRKQKWLWNKMSKILGPQSLMLTVWSRYQLWPSPHLRVLFREALDLSHRGCLLLLFVDQHISLTSWNDWADRWWGQGFINVDVSKRLSIATTFGPIVNMLIVRTDDKQVGWMLSCPAS